MTTESKQQPASTKRSPLNLIVAGLSVLLVVMAGAMYLQHRNIADLQSLVRSHDDLLAAPQPKVRIVNLSKLTEVAVQQTSSPRQMSQYLDYFIQLLEHEGVVAITATSTVSNEAMHMPIPSYDQVMAAAKELDLKPTQDYAALEAEFDQKMETLMGGFGQ